MRVAGWVILLGLLSLGTLLAVMVQVTGPRVRIEGARLPTYQEPRGPHLVEMPRPRR